MISCFLLFFVSLFLFLCISFEIVLLLSHFFYRTFILAFWRSNCSVLPFFRCWPMIASCFKILNQYAVHYSAHTYLIFKWIQTFDVIPIYVNIAICSMLAKNILVVCCDYPAAVLIFRTQIWKNYFSQPSFSFKLQSNISTMKSLL